MTDNQQNLISDSIKIGGKEYLKSSSSRVLSEEIKKTGSFINVLANKLSIEAAPGKNVAFWG